MFHRSRIVEGTRYAGGHSSGQSSQRDWHYDRRCSSCRRPQSRLRGGICHSHRPISPAALLADRAQPQRPRRRRRHHPGSLHQGLSQHSRLPWRGQSANLALPHCPPRSLQSAPLVVPPQEAGDHHRLPRPSQTPTRKVPASVSAQPSPTMQIPPSTTPPRPNSASTSNPPCASFPRPSAPS